MSQRSIGITGPNGFIAKHLTRRFQNETAARVVLCPREAFQDPQQLSSFVAECDTIIHLAGMNRGTDQEIRVVNRSLSEKLVTAAASCKHELHLVYASSTQRELDNVYGQSKQECEQLFQNWSTGNKQRTATSLVIPNVYGAGCKPYYNSVVATFCHQLAQKETPQIHQDKIVNFIWINDLVDEIVRVAFQPPPEPGLHEVSPTATTSISGLLEKLEGFRKNHFEDDLVPDLTDRFDSSLYSTFESYLDLEDHTHRPQVHADDRGKLFEVLRVANAGQIFFSTTHPGVIRGNHFHTRKVEWFCVLQGEAAIRLRHIESSEIKEFRVSGESPQFISIPVLHTHQIENIGTEELLTMFWCNETYNAADADTYFEDVA